MWQTSECQDHLGSPAGDNTKEEESRTLCFRSELVFGFDGNICPDSLLKSMHQKLTCRFEVREDS